MPKLSEPEIESALDNLPGWTLSGGKLIHDYSFPDFVAAMAFVNRVAGLAESANHHPDIDIRYNQVRLGLVSHDANGITSRDIRMAAALNANFPQTTA
jgi:4a-hydroxytetrahydrobiopterin dehydratase